MRTDSLSNYEPVLSDGSVGSAPTLGLSPGPSNTMDISRNEQNQMKDTTTMHQHKAEEVKKKPQTGHVRKTVVRDENYNMMFVLHILLMLQEGL